MSIRKRRKSELGEAAVFTTPKDVNNQVEPKRRKTEIPIDKAKDNASIGIFSGQTFNDLSTNGLISSRILKQMVFLGYEKVTRIQREAIPAVMSGRDVLMRCQTGSGKTLAFVIPALEKLLSTCNTPNTRFMRSDGTRVAIVAPTRELVSQTVEVFSKCCQMVPDIVVGAVSGGEKRKAEKSRLRKGVTILGGTPGRLLDHLETTASFIVRNLILLVLDEADRLLDLGFEKQIRKIWTILSETGAKYDELECWRPVKDCSEAKDNSSSAVSKSSSIFQVVLVSATLSDNVKRLASFCLRIDPLWVDVNDSAHPSKANLGSDEVLLDALNSSTTSHSDVCQVPDNLVQKYVVVRESSRLLCLLALLQQKLKNGKALVFLSTCESVTFHHHLLPTLRWPSCMAVHGDSSKASVDNRKMRGKASKRKSSKVNSSSGIVNAESDDSDDSNSDGDDQHDTTKSGGIHKSDTPKEWTFLKSGTDGETAENWNKTMSGDLVFPETKFFKLHGSLTKEDREGNLKDFKQAKRAVMFATDVASRGLNFPEVNCVLQYDTPQQGEEYVHRIGRTARIGKAGEGIIFLQSHEVSFVDYIKSRSTSVITELPQLHLTFPFFRDCAPLYLSKTRDITALLQKFFVKMLSNNNILINEARTAYLSTIRSYKGCSKDLRTHFDTKELHLGKFATSFCLDESPSKIALKNKLNVVSNACKEGAANKNISPELQRKFRQQNIYSSNPNAKSVFDKSGTSQLKLKKTLRCLEMYNSAEPQYRKGKKRDNTTNALSEFM